MTKANFAAKAAVINIGSNSVKMLLPDESKFGFKKVITTQLAQGSSENGRILDLRSMARTEQAVLELYADAAETGARRIFIYGTEALRKAENAGEMKEAIEAATGAAVELIDGRTEALCAVLGAGASFPDERVFCDIGGASTELAEKKEAGDISCASFPIGAVRLEGQGGQDFEKLSSASETVIDTLPRCRRIVGLGGTFSSLAAIACGLKEFDRDKIHGTYLTRFKLEEIGFRLKDMGADDIGAAFPFLGSPRARVLKAGLSIALTVLNRTGADGFKVSQDDGLKGYLVMKGIL